MGMGADEEDNPIEAVFTRFDKDGSGYLELDEVPWPCFFLHLYMWCTQGRF